MSRHEVEMARSPAASLEFLSQEAPSWGAKWQRDGSRGGRLELPVLAGLRRGWVEGPVTVEGSDSGSRLTFRVESEVYRLETLSVVILVAAAAGALVFLVAPFIPALRPAVPVGILLTVAAWLFIVARLRNSGPEEFFEWLAREAEGLESEAEGLESEPHSPG